MIQVISIGGVLLFLDQIVKYIVSTSIALGDTINVIPNIFYITNLENRGAAWSMFSGSRFFLVTCALIALFVIYYFFIKNKKISKPKKVYYGLLFGGILGNLVDRIIHGYVIDFIGVYIGTYAFPIFNIADIAIVIGSILCIIDVYRGDKNDTKSK